MHGRSAHAPYNPRPAFRVRIEQTDWEKAMTLEIALATEVPYRRATGPIVALEWLGRCDPAYLDFLLGTTEPDAKPKLFYALVAATDYFAAEIAAADKAAVEAAGRGRPRTAIAV